MELFIIAQLLEFSIFHITSFDECFVHSKAVIEVERCMCQWCFCEIVAEHFAILWVNTIVDDAVCTLDWRFTTKVSHTMFSDKDFH